MEIRTGRSESEPMIIDTIGLGLLEIGFGSGALPVENAASMRGRADSSTSRMDEPTMVICPILRPGRPGPLP